MEEKEEGVEREAMILHIFLTVPSENVRRVHTKSQVKSSLLLV